MLYDATTAALFDGNHNSCLTVEEKTHWKIDITRTADFKSVNFWVITESSESCDQLFFIRTNQPPCSTVKTCKVIGDWSSVSNMCYISCDCSEKLCHLEIYPLKRSSTFEICEIYN